MGQGPRRDRRNWNQTSSGETVHEQAKVLLIF